MCIYLNIIISYRFQLRTKYTSFFWFRFKILAIVSSKKRVTFRALESLGIAQRITFCQERLLCAVTEADLLGDLLGINSASKMRWLIHREKIELVCVLSLNVDMLQQTCDEFRPQTLPSYHMIHTRSWGSWLCQVIPVRSAAMVTSMCIFHYLSRTPKKTGKTYRKYRKKTCNKKSHVLYF